MADESAPQRAPSDEGPGESDLAPGIDPETLERRRLALREVRQFGDPVLKSKASPVKGFSAELEREAEHMIALMQNALGIGLAATQVGVMRRLLVFQAGTDSEPRALVNPAIEWVSGDLVTATEGCLSLADVVVDVERPLHARVRAVDVRGEPLEIEASGLEARVLQHEIDHLDGVLILDRTERPQRRAALRALRAGEHFDPAMLDPGRESGDPADPEVDDFAGGEAARDGAGEP